MSLFEKQSVILSLPVWGNEYIKTFFEFCLPFFFTKNNLIYLKNEKKFLVKFILHTYEKHVDEIKKFKSYQELVNLINVEFRLIDDLKFDVIGTERQKQFCALIASQKNIILEARKDNSIILFFNADVIFSENMIKKIFSYIDKGYKAICISSLRLAKNKIIEKINKISKFNFSSRELVKIALKNLHPAFINLNLEKKRIPTCLSILFWQLDENNILLRSFHLHPLAIWPEKEVALENTIDDSFLFESCSANKIKVIDDSDEFVLFELTDEKNDNILGFQAKRPYLHLIRWCSDSLKEGHWKNIENKIFYKTKNYDSKWKKIEKKTDLFYLRLKKIVKIYQFLKICKIIFILKIIKKLLRFIVNSL